MSKPLRKILIVYVSAGEGHRACAEAINRHLKDNHPEFDLCLVDVLDQTNFCFKQMYSKGYAFLVTQVPLLWKIFYAFTSISHFQRLFMHFRRFFNLVNSKRFRSFLSNYNPDIIISTHFLATEIIAGLKKKKDISAYLCSVVTDFTVHPFWVFPQVDKYAVACQITKQQIISRGIEKEKILVCGIPVHDKFHRQYRKEGLCEKFGLKKERFTVLVAMSGFGSGPMKKIVDALKSQVQLLVVCGKNKKLFSRLKRMDLRDVMLFEFIDNIEELMVVSDLMVTKAGGMTIFECIALNLPMIFFQVIPGQEAGNLKVLKEFGIETFAPERSTLRDKVIEFKSSPSSLADLKKKLEKINRPHTLNDLIDAICKDSSRIAG